VHFHQRLTLGDVLAFLFAPRPDGDLFSALQVRHHDFLDLDTHPTIVAPPEAHLWRQSCGIHRLEAHG